jgi:signal recognition particle receptor subunit beta
VHFDAESRELTLKVVYYGPPLSGKTTNLTELQSLLNPEAREKLTALSTSDDRTLFCDLLPVWVGGDDKGLKIKLKVFTVPGQMVHAATRRVVLSGADGVVFVADSQVSEGARNNEYWHGMRYYLKDSGIDPDRIPMVIQFNKRDLANVRDAQDLQECRKLVPEPIFEAVALRGEGVLETLAGLLDILFADVKERFGFEDETNLNAEDFLTKVFGKRPNSPDTTQRAVGDMR